MFLFSFIILLILQRFSNTDRILTLFLVRPSRVSGYTPPPEVFSDIFGQLGEILLGIFYILGYGLEKYSLVFRIAAAWPRHPQFFLHPALGSLLLILVAHDLMNILQTFQQNRIEGAALLRSGSSEARINGNRPSYRLSH